MNGTIIETRAWTICVNSVLSTPLLGLSGMRVGEVAGIRVGHPLREVKCAELRTGRTPTPRTIERPRFLSATRVGCA